MKFELGEIQEATLIPLVIRAQETKRPKPRIRDEKAVEIVDSLDIEKIGKYDKFLSHEGVVARTIMFDDAVKSLLLQYPDAVCVNLGCRFDNRFSRVDNGQITWYDVDLPNVFASRRKVFPPQNRVYLVQGNVTTPEWTKFIPKCKPVIVIAEDLFTHFNQEEVKACLSVLSSSFPRGTLVAELMRAANTKKGAAKDAPVTFGWGTKSGHDLEELNGHFKLVREVSVNKEMKRHTLRGKALNIVARNVNNHMAIFNWN